MNQMRAVLFLGLAALPLAACQKDPPPAPASPTATASASETPAAAATPTADLPNGDFNVVGVVTKVDDAGYPMFALTIMPDGAKEPLELLWNNEEATKPADMQISDFRDKRAEIAWSRKPQLDLEDISQNGKSLLKREPGEPLPPKSAQSVTGKLSGAKALSGGDLPDVITVTDAAGKTYDFEMFISDKAVVDANGKEVTVGYSNSQRDDAKAIKLAPPKP